MNESVTKKVKRGLELVLPARYYRLIRACYWGLPEFQQLYRQNYLLDQGKKKSIFLEILEVIQLTLYFQCVPIHYLSLRMYRKDFSEKLFDFIPEAALNGFRDNMNPKEARNAVIDKKIFARVMKRNNLPAICDVHTISYDSSTKDDLIMSTKFEEFIKLFSDLDVKELFLKPLDGVRSIGAFQAVLNSNKLYIDQKEVNEKSFFNLLFSGKRFTCYLVQPVIRQHEVLRRINPSCVNPVRIDTLLLREQIVHNFAVLCVGNGTNSAYGGEGRLLVKIDLDTGKLAPFGKVLTTAGDRTVYAHPVSRASFANVTLPFWSEVKALVHSAAPLLYPLRSIGWDVAITPNGPLLIEANHDQELCRFQLAAGGLANTPMGREIFKRLRPADV